MLNITVFCIYCYKYQWGRVCVSFMDKLITECSTLQPLFKFHNKSTHAIRVVLLECRHCYMFQSLKRYNLSACYPRFLTCSFYGNSVSAIPSLPTNGPVQSWRNPTRTTPSFCLLRNCNYYIL